jgi:subtilisin family serine protease
MLNKLIFEMLALVLALGVSLPSAMLASEQTTLITLVNEADFATVEFGNDHKQVVINRTSDYLLDHTGKIALAEEYICANNNYTDYGQLMGIDDTYCTRQCVLNEIQYLPIYTRNDCDKVIVAVLDSGIDTNHEDLAGMVIDSINFTSSDTTLDKNGHGTHVAGIIGTCTDNNIGFIRTAPDLEILNIKVAEDSGIVWASRVAKGIIWAVDHQASVINMSLVILNKSKALEKAVRYAWSHDVVLVAAAGSNPKKMSYPAAFPEVIAVAASNPDCSALAESNTGTFINVYAPGVDIYSTLPDNTYGYMSGSSMASAYVTSVVALALHSNVED